MSSRAQSAIEFMILVGAVLFFFTSFLLLIYGNIADKQYEKRTLVIEDIAQTVQEEISLAHAADEGYRRVFALPPTALSFPYNVSLVDGYVYVRTSNGKHAVAYPVLNVSGTVIIGDNVIRKNNNTVFLNA